MSRGCDLIALLPNKFDRKRRMMAWTATSFNGVHVVHVVHVVEVVHVERGA